MSQLSDPELRTIVSSLAQVLDHLGITYAIMGGAAVHLLTGDPNRHTKDVDLVIQVDHRNITADKLTQQLLTLYPNYFGSVNQFGHTIPGFKLGLPGGGFRLVELEIFDHQSWPQRPQYNLQTTVRSTIAVEGRMVKTFNPQWILREKILSQYQRQGTPKEVTDIRDVINMLPVVAANSPELDFNSSPVLKTALANLLGKRPQLLQQLRQKIRCTAVFGGWQGSFSST